MKIDLSDIPAGVAENDWDLKLLKCNKIYNELKKIKGDFNLILVSMPVLNILENHHNFIKCKDTDFSYDEPGMYLVGEIFSIQVYVDLFLFENQVVLTYDKQTIREFKIESLIEGGKVKRDLLVRVCD